MNIDHVILGARTIAPLREWLRDAHGLGITDGSPNPDATASWIVPLDTPRVQYLELLVVHDESALAASGFGRLFLERTADGPAFLNWAVLSDDIDADAARVKELTGRDPELLRGESVRADGQTVPWAEAAFAASWETPSRPFFLEYANWPARRSRVAGDLAAAGHRVRPTALAALTVTTARTDLDDWLGTGDLPVATAPPPPGAPTEAVLSVELTTDDGPLLLEVP